MAVDIEPVRAFVVCLRSPSVPVTLDLGADDGDGLGRQPPPPFGVLFRPSSMRATVLSRSAPLLPAPSMRCMASASGDLSTG